MDSGTRDPCSAFLGEIPSLPARRRVHRQDRAGSGGRSHMADPGELSSGAARDARFGSPLGERNCPSAVLGSLTAAATRCCASLN